MALLNEKRNRIPQVAVLPATGDDGGIRGQMRMINTAGVASILVCTTSDEDLVSTLAVAGAVGSMTYTSKAVGDAGEEISVAHATGGAAIPVVSVVGKAITVTGDATTTAAQIVTAIEGSAAAAALVTVDAGTFTTLVAVGAAFLSGGAGDKATLTANTDLVLTAKASGSAGNDITLTIVDVLGSELFATVDGTDITITGDAAVHTTADMVATINKSTRANKLVVASGGSAQVLAAAASAPLTGGTSLAVWTAMAIA